MKSVRALAAKIIDIDRQQLLEIICNSIKLNQKIGNILLKF